MHNPFDNDVDPPEPYGDWQKACILCQQPVDPADILAGFNLCPACTKEAQQYRAYLWDLKHEDPSGEMFGWLPQ